MVTRSPFLTPNDFKTLASFLTCSNISPYVIFLSVPSSPSHKIAVLSDFDFWCTSKALYDALSFPPTNHFAKGGFHCRVLLHGSNQDKDFAHSSQNDR